MDNLRLHCKITVFGHQVFAFIFTKEKDQHSLFTKFWCYESNVQNQNVERLARG